MIRFTTLMLCAAAAVGAANAQTIYSNALNTQAEFDEWTVIDANQDDCTWKFSESNDDGRRTYYNYHSTNAASDWLISPAITPQESGTYLVSYNYEGGASMAEAMKVYYGSAPTIEALSQNCAKDYPSVTGAHSDFFFVEGEAGVPFYVAFYACSEADKFRLYAQGLVVKKADNPVDLAVTELLTPQSGEGLSNAEQVKVKVSNAGLADAEAGSYKVTVTVDGQEAFSESPNVAIAKDATVELTLSGTLDLSVSHHTYTVAINISHDQDISESNNTLTTYVRHIGPAVEPYTMGFEASEDVSDIKFFNLNDDSGYWSIQTNSFWVSPSRTGVRSMCYNYNKENAADDWAILDGIQMEAGYHVLKFWVSTMDDTHTEGLHVAYGTSATPDAMVNELASYDPFTTAPYIQKICIFQLSEPQTVYIGFHATSPANQNWIGIDDITVNSISADDVELSLSDLSNPSGYVPQLSNKDVKFDVMNQGISAVDATVKVTIDDNEVYSTTVNLEAQEERSFAIADLLTNIAEGNHNLKVTVSNDNETNLEDNTAETSFRLMGDPDLYWDFEEGEVPPEFTIREEDGNTLSAEAIEEFGETGVGIMNIDTHPYYGNYMLGISSWFESAGYADRWVVLPQVKVNSDDACFVFNAGSTNAYISEKYSIKVSADRDYWVDYDTCLTVNPEGTTRRNRGIELGDYKDKDVYVAINLTTYDGDCLTVDNLALFGCSLSESGVKQVGNDDSQALINVKGQIIAAQGAKIDVYTPGGLRVLTGNDSLNTSELPGGIYIVKATCGTATQVVKIQK